MVSGIWKITSNGSSPTRGAIKIQVSGDLMAMIQCPECKGEISDQAKTCPKCGFDISAKKKNTYLLSKQPIWDGVKLGAAFGIIFGVVESMTFLRSSYFTNDLIWILFGYFTGLASLLFFRIKGKSFKGVVSYSGGYFLGAILGFVCVPFIKVITHHIF